MEMLAILIRDLLGHKGMIHTALLVSRKNEYNKWSFEKRKDVFSTLYNFARKIGVRLKSVVIDKKYFNMRIRLKKKLKDEMEKFIRENGNYINSYKKVIIFYDDVEFVSKFNHEDNRIFQVADMLTVFDKLDFKIKNRLLLVRMRKSFFILKSIVFFK